MLRFGIIGAGIISARHLKAIEKNPQTLTVAVADLDLEKARSVADAYGASAYTDYKEMLDKEVLDAVIINLPHYLHEESTRCCTQKGIHVLVEKPMSVSSSSCQAMTQVCRDHGTILQIGHIQRYFPENKKAKELIDSHALGKLLMIQDVRTSLYFTENRPKWFLDKALSGGGILMNLGAHSIDKIKYLTGSTFAEVTGYCGFEHPDYSIEGNAQLFLKTKSGVTACITLCGYHPLPINETTLYFSGGVLKLNTGKNLEIWKDGTFQELAATDEQQPFEEQLEDFVRAISDGILPAADGPYSQDIISVIESIYQKTGEHTNSLCAKNVRRNGDYHENNKQALSQL